MHADFSTIIRRKEVVLPSSKKYVGCAVPTAIYQVLLGRAECGSQCFPTLASKKTVFWVTRVDDRVHPPIVFARSSDWAKEEFLGAELLLDLYIFSGTRVNLG